MESFFRYISYVDYYEMGLRLHNAGFLRWKMQGNKHRVEIQIKDVPGVKGLYPITEEQTKDTIASIRLEHGRGSFLGNFYSVMKGGQIFLTLEKKEINLSKVKAFRIDLGSSKMLRIPVELPCMSVEEELSMELEATASENVLIDGIEEKYEPAQDLTKLKEKQEENVMETGENQREGMIKPKSTQEKYIVESREYERGDVVEKRNESENVIESKGNQREYAKEPEDNSKEHGSESDTNQKRYLPELEKNAIEYAAKPEENQRVNIMKPENNQRGYVTNSGENERRCVKESRVNHGEYTMEPKNNQRSYDTKPQVNQRQDMTESDRWSKENRQETSTTVRKRSVKLTDTFEASVPLMENKWQQLCAQYPIVHPFPSGRAFLSIKPTDFIILQQGYQKLVHNSFLLHGYYNYRHMILGKLADDEEAPYYIGVPGVYYERERQAAQMFGFVGFEGTELPVQNGSYGYYMIEVEI